MTAGWQAPERAARATASSIGVGTEEAPELAAWWGPDEDEPLDGMLARVGDWLDGVDPEIRRGLVVASPPIVRALAVRALGAHPPVFWRLDVATLSVTVLTRTGSHWRLRSLSDA